MSYVRVLASETGRVRALASVGAIEQIDTFDVVIRIYYTSSEKFVIAPERRTNRV